MDSLAASGFRQIIENKYKQISTWPAGLELQETGTTLGTADAKIQGTLDSGETSTRSENTILGKCPKVTFRDFGMVWNVERSHMPKTAFQDSGEILNVERSRKPQKLCLDSRTTPNVNRG